MVSKSVDSEFQPAMSIAIYKLTYLLNSLKVYMYVLLKAFMKCVLLKYYKMSTYQTDCANIAQLQL